MVSASVVNGNFVDDMLVGKLGACSSQLPRAFTHSRTKLGSCGLLKKYRRSISPRQRFKGFQSPAVVSALRPNETPEEALERRLKESERVEERVTYVETIDDFEFQMEKAGDRLVVVEVGSQTVCMSGWEEEPELQWKEDQKAALEPCLQLKHTFQRTARDCPDVVFLMVDADSDTGDELCGHLGVDVLPTLQFWRHGSLLWEHKGVVQLNQDLGEGVLYFGDTAGNNEKASTYIKDLSSKAEFESFIKAPEDDKTLVVIDISVSDANPCVHIFPAVLALAKNFTGLARFARVLGDQSDELQELMGEKNVLQVPTFLFYRGGKEIGRHVGSSRGDLIGQILAQQNAAGIPPPSVQGKPLRRKARTT